MATLIGILKETQALLALKVPKLSTGNVEYTASISDYKPRIDRFGAVVFGMGFRADGFKGGIEFKEVRLNIAFLHVRDTDTPHEDILRAEMLLVHLADKAMEQLQARFLTGDGTLDEPLELLSQASPESPKGTSLIRVDQVWRCMYAHYLLRDRLSA